MLHSPLKTALAYECFQDQASSTLALPSDHKLKTKGTGKQRVQEQVMMTVKRQKQKSSVSSSVGHSNRGKVPQQGICSRAGLVLCSGVLWWGFGLYNGTLKRDAESRRYSSYSQMEGWASRAHGKALCSPRAGSDYCFVQNIKSSRSDVYTMNPQRDEGGQVRAEGLRCSQGVLLLQSGRKHTQKAVLERESS
uniref:Uncharacterized protein n=1 Tax=Malurus cyaneus samueli TaxID=2593467 RepID=A0A8C5T4S9_9PASS